MNTTTSNKNQREHKKMQRETQQNELEAKVLSTGSCGSEPGLGRWLDEVQVCPRPGHRKQKQQARWKHNQKHTKSKHQPGRSTLILVFNFLSCISIQLRENEGRLKQWLGDYPRGFSGKKSPLSQSRRLPKLRQWYLGINVQHNMLQQRSIKVKIICSHVSF